MKRKMIFGGSLIGIVILATISVGCARKTEELGAVRQESSTVKFNGYKLSVLVDASPEELENYLTDPDKLKQELGKLIKLERLSGKRFSRVGDSADYQFRVLNVATVPYRMTMIRYQPLDEIWYMTETKNEFIVSVLRYQMKRVKDGTILTVRFELEEPQDPFTKGIDRAINFQESIIKGTEQGTAMIQAYFNKNLTVPGLLEKGLRGEFYVSFFSFNRLSVLVNAPPPKVHRYLTDPATWKKWETEYQVYNMGPCLVDLKAGSCQAKINIVGVDYTLDFFSAQQVPGKFVSSYFTSPVMGLGWIRTFINPVDKGADLGIEYMVQISQASPAGTQFLINLSQLPKIIEKIILDAKNNCELP